ncbi:MAG: hypothetical protein WBG53_11445 [Rhodococcus sp. (in: high G+C Gram-positive bacteria)]
MEPMRPVDYVEQPPDPATRRKQRWRQLFLVCLVICQFIALTVYDIEFWWALVGTVIACGLYELFWAVINRNMSDQG